MPNNSMHVATFHLPQPVKNLAVMLCGIESQYPGSYAKPTRGYEKDTIEIWAPAPAGVQILDLDADLADEEPEPVAV